MRNIFGVLVQCTMDFMHMHAVVMQAPPWPGYVYCTQDDRNGWGGCWHGRARRATVMMDL